MEGKAKDAILAEMPPRWSTFFLSALLKNTFAIIWILGLAQENAFVNSIIEG